MFVDGGVRLASPAMIIRNWPPYSLRCMVLETILKKRKRQLSTTGSHLLGGVLYSKHHQTTIKYFVNIRTSFDDCIYLAIYRAIIFKGLFLFDVVLFIANQVSLSHVLTFKVIM